MEPKGVGITAGAWPAWSLLGNMGIDLHFWLRVLLSSQLYLLGALFLLLLMLMLLLLLILLLLLLLLLSSSMQWPLVIPEAG